MKNRRFIVALTAGTAISVAGCTKEATSTPEPVPPMTNPPAQQEGPPVLEMPTWEQVQSNHPKGATNPPSPQLIVDYAGSCYKRWVDPRRDSMDELAVCSGAACGTQVVCNEAGKALYQKWKDGQAGLPSWDGVSSGHPQGATNPPRPVSIVTGSGTCWKDWTSGMRPPTPATDDRLVASCSEETCGTQVQCSPSAIEQLTAPTEK